MAKMMAPNRLLLLSTLLLLLLAFTFSLSIVVASAQPQDDDEEAAADRITYLPGYPHELPSRHFGGYIRVGDDDDDGGAQTNATVGRHHRRPGTPPARNLYYYMVASERDPDADPVVLWLNGGPGCSSFDAFVYEHGPFTFAASTANGVSDGGLPTLRPNPYSWSKVATMIYLDSPANVGLSFVDPDVDPSTGAIVAPNDSYHTNDTHTAQDADAFLRGFFRRHPRLLNNPFYITGESYAGIYVPNLARQVVRSNAAGVEPKINLRGYAVGNGCTDAQYDGNALPPFLAGRGLMPLDEFERLRETCNGSYWDAEGFEWALSAKKGRWAGGREGGNATASSSSNRAAMCGKALEKAIDKALDGINIYDTLDLCHASHRPRAEGEEEDGQGGAKRLAGARLQRQQQQQQLPAWARVASLALPNGRFDISPRAQVAALQPGARVAASAAAAASPDADAAPAPAPPSNAAPAPPRPPTPPPLSHNPPCTSATLAEDWLNNEAVRRAIHAAPIFPEGGGDPAWAAGWWALCSDRLRYTHDAGSMLPVHAELLPGLPGWPKMLARAGLREEAERAWARRAEVAALSVAGDEEQAPSTSSPPPKLRALIYTGDHDAAVPSTGSEAWTTDIGGGKPLPGKQWRPWRVRLGTDGGGRPAEGEDAAAGIEQVGGYTREFPGGLTYATVRGAGHMVPTSKPLEALRLFQAFVDGDELAPPLKEEAEEKEEKEEGEFMGDEDEDPLDGGGALSAPPTTAAGGGAPDAATSFTLPSHPAELSMPRGRQLLLLALLGLAPAAWFAGRITDPALLRSVLLATAVSFLGYTATRWLVPKVARKTQARGICGKDINKRGTPAGDVPIPESAGLAPACVFLGCLVLTEALHYAFAAALAASSASASSSGGGKSAIATTLSDAWLVDYNAALATVGFMAFLGFADDVLDVPWRVKLALPVFAALPLTAAYSGGTAMSVPKPLRPLLGRLFCSSGIGGATAKAAAANSAPFAWLESLARRHPALAAALPPLAPGGGLCANGALGPTFLQLGWLYRAYIVALLVFSSNAINILAGVNGLEAGQTFVVSCAILAFNLASLAAGVGGGGGGGTGGGKALSSALIPNRDGHLFSLYVSAPLAATSLALLTFNWYPARVFVGDTFTLFAGAALASAGILGHYSETLLLFLAPQVFNFLYSIPQLAGWVFCPRHRLPVLDPKTGLLAPKPGAPDLNLVNLTLRVFGPCGENALCARVLALQALSCAATFGARWALAGWYK